VFFFGRRNINCTRVYLYFFLSFSLFITKKYQIYNQISFYYFVPMMATFKVCIICYHFFFSSLFDAIYFYVALVPGNLVVSLFELIIISSSQYVPCVISYPLSQLGFYRMCTVLLRQIHEKVISLFMINDRFEQCLDRRVN
jgi:hypothetical protein